jgi:hypothetical protein
MDTVVLVLVTGIAAAVIWGLTETWRHQRRSQRHRNRQDEASKRDEKRV